MGYYMSLDTGKLGLNSFKLFLQIDNSREIEEFEKYIKVQNKNVAKAMKMGGLEK